jgi:hypothetical protein
MSAFVLVGVGACYCECGLVLVGVVRVGMLVGEHVCLGACMCVFVCLIQSSIYYGLVRSFTVCNTLQMSDCRIRIHQGTSEIKT